MFWCCIGGVFAASSFWRRSFLFTLILFKNVEYFLFIFCFVVFMVLVFLVSG